jgi:hypothetical protein
LSNYESPEVQQRIAISTGVNAAAALAAGTADPAGYFTEILPVVVGAVIDVHAQFANVTGAQPVNPVATAAAAVGAAFPGTTVVPPAQAAQVFPPAVVATVPVVAAPTAPAAIPGAADGDPATAALWQEFFTDLQRTGFDNWFDNRLSKKTAQSPDFKKKGVKEGGGLWRESKKNPSWVAGALQQMGL